MGIAVGSVTWKAVWIIASSNGLKSASVTPRILDEDSALANGAADALDAVQIQFRFFVDYGGESWRYGQLLCHQRQGPPGRGRLTSNIVTVLRQIVDDIFIPLVTTGQSTR